MTILLKSVYHQSLQWSNEGTPHPPSPLKGLNLKIEGKWDQNGIKKDSLNAKAMNALVCALSSDQFNMYIIVRPEKLRISYK